MRANENFKIKYVSPGVVRSGLDDFALIYSENSENITFQVESFRASNNSNLYYVVKVPEYLKQTHYGNVILSRIRNFIKSDSIIQALHGNISLSS